ncbi:immunity 21 family protein [Microbispora sp. NBC_01189]|uniref:Imm21 family immunity protein n=1 Tax=unclassified Microbispora TaxID=2614687 RepID=UPI002E111D73|nr:immunity 21 family protein [Microbispora sp. NBC_01189]
MAANDPKQADSGGLTWVSTLGGPHILVPQSVLSYWHGAPVDYPEDEGDYGRACSVQSYIGLIDVGPSQALVVAGELGATTYLPERNVIIQRVGMRSAARYAQEASTLTKAVVGIIDAGTVPEDEEVTWTVEESVILFDSVHGHEYVASEDHLWIDLRPGRYKVRAAYVELPEERIVLVWLNLSAVASSSF